MKVIAICVAVVTIAFASSLGVTRTSASEYMSRSIDPVVLLGEGGIRGCGFSAAFDRSGDAPARISLRLMRSPAARSGTQFVLSAVFGPDAAIELDRLSLATAALDTGPLFSAPRRADEAGTLETRGELGPLEGGQLFRDVLVSGGVVTVARRGGPPIRLGIASPAPASVRAAYLQCAGDLFRPEEKPGKAPAHPGR